MVLSHEVKEGFPSITVLHVAGAIDGSNYLNLINEVKELCAHETEYLLLDLENCNFLSSAGLFALHSIALITHNHIPLDPQNGWSSLHTMTDEKREFKEKFKIVHLQPNIQRTLEIAGMLSLFDIYADIEESLSAFKPVD